MKVHGLWLSASVLTLCWSGAALAQDAPKEPKAQQVEEVTVTAERRTTNLQTTPIAATVMSGADLEKDGIITVDQLQFSMPGAVVNNFGQGIDFNIRGIGKAEHNTQTLTGVITYRDAVATFPGYFTQEPYYDIARVEVLRGPQGTFVGENATGGAVFVTSNDPKLGGGHSGYIAAQVGNYSNIGAQGAVNLPISDTFAARIAFNVDARDSFYDFTGTNYENDGRKRTGSARLSLLWKPNDQLTALWKTDYSYLDLGAYPADPQGATNDPFKLTANSPQQALDRFVRNVLKVDYVTAGGITLRSVTGYQFGNSRYKADLDGTSVGVNTFKDSVDEQIWSQEINVISPDTGRFTWIGGLYAQTDGYDFPKDTFIIGTPPTNPLGVYNLWGTNRRQTLAAFGQVTFDLTDSLELQVGARYAESRTKNVVNVIQYTTPIFQVQSETYTGLSSKVSLNWTINEHHFIYGFWAIGHRPGGLNVPVGLGPPAPFDSEKVTSYEIGWKAGWLDGRVRTSIDAYYNDYRNFQVIIGYPAFPTFGFELNTPNPAKIYGIEAQVEAVFGNFSFDAGMGLMHSEIGTFYAVDPRAGSFVACNPATGPASAACLNLGGRNQTYAPEFTFNAGAEYDFNLNNGDTVTPRLSFGHVSDQWATLFQNRARGDYVPERNIWNGQIAWRHGDIITTLYGTNIGDLHYKAALNSGLRFVGPPRQYGIRVLKVF